MTIRVLSAAAAFVLTGCLLFGIKGDPVAAGDRSANHIETATMSNDQPPGSAAATGFSYSAELASKFGLSAADAIEFEAPLQGVAMELRKGIAGGTICTLHVLFDASVNMRLPDADRLASISGQRSQLPFALLQKPDKEIRRQISSQVRALSNRAIARFGKSALTGAATAGDDPEGSYTSMPLDAYDREFVPGVGWLAMSINCALAASDDYSHLSLYVESNSSPSEMILNQHVDPAKMIELKVPGGFYAGMKPALRAAVASDDSVQGRIRPPAAFTVIGGQKAD